MHSVSVESYPQNCVRPAQLLLQALRHKADRTAAHGAQKLANQRPLAFWVGGDGEHGHPLGFTHSQGHPEDYKREIALI